MHVARLLLSVLVVSTSACYLSTPYRSDEERVDGCSPAEAEIACVEQRGGACGAWSEVDPLCGDDGTWRCPAGAAVHVAVEEPPGPCLPFFAVEDGAFAVLAGVGVEIETDDGRCLWSAGYGETTAGERISHAAGALPSPLPFGACPTEGDWLGGDRPRSIADEGSLGEGAVVSLRSTVRVDGTTWVFFRQWIWDEDAVFGLRKVGSGVARWSDSVGAIDLGPGLVWRGDADFGDAAFVVDDAVLLLGCYGEPDFLTFHCRLARHLGASLGDGTGWEYYRDGPTDEWTARLADAVPVVASGPERAVVAFHEPTGRWLHVFAVGFGSDLEIRSAPTPEGPWSDAVVLAACDLPTGDPDAFCREPVLRPSLADPLRPTELVLTYNVDTLAEGGDARRRASPAAYWPRLVRAEIPAALR